jgi:hypothetical protein
MVAAVMRMVMSIIDITSISPVLLWSCVEEAVVLTVANMPMLRVFFWRGKNFLSAAGTSQVNTTLSGTGRNQPTINDGYELSSQGRGITGMVTSPKDRRSGFVDDDAKAVLCSVEVNVETMDIDEDASTTKSESADWRA